MRIYGSFGPNPRALRIFLAEKGLEIPTVEVDLVGGENRRAPYTDLNPGGQLPSLELDDGTVLAETVAIFEYLEELHPAPALIGANAKGAPRRACGSVASSCASARTSTTVSVLPKDSRCSRRACTACPKPPTA